MIRPLDRIQGIIERTYTDTAEIVETRMLTDESTHITAPETHTLGSYPCRLSHKLVAANATEHTAGEVIQEIKLFLTPSVTVKPGSKITVTHDGVTETYEASGLPAVYSTHQEIILKHAAKGRWA